MSKANLVILCALLFLLLTVGAWSWTTPILGFWFGKGHVEICGVTGEEIKVGLRIRTVATGDAEGDVVYLTLGRENYRADLNVVGETRVGGSFSRIDGDSASPESIEAIFLRQGDMISGYYLAGVIENSLDCGRRSIEVKLRKP